MKESRQEATHRCDCGRDVPVVRVTAFEFTWRCPCGRAEQIGWAHANNPPLWHPQVGQLEFW